MMSEIGNDLNRLSSLSPQRRLLLVGLIALLFALSLLVGTYLLGNKDNSQVGQEVPAPTAVVEQTTLSISPENLSLTTGQPQQMSVVLSDIAVSAADVVLQFDPALVTIADVQNGDVFDRVIRNNVANGTLTFSAAVAPENKDQLKTGTVLTFTVTPLKSGTSLITFDRKKTITAVEGVNTAGTLTNAQIQIQ